MLGKIIKAAIALAITSTFIGGIVAGSFRTMIGASFWRTVAQNTVLLGLNYLTTKGSNNTTARNLGTPQAFTNPIAARNTVYGKTRVGGTIVYRDVTLNTKELRQIIAVAAHEINDIKKIFLNNGNETFELSLTTDFSESSGVYTITNTNFVNTDNDDAYGSGGLVKVIYEKGDQTTVNSAIQTAIGSSTWTNDHKLQGIAYIYISCIFDAEKWKGYPTFSFEIEGKKVYDPRTSTTVYSTNPALIIRDYLKDTVYGFGAFDSEINDDTTGAGFIKAANDCDDDITLTAGTEDRYTLNGEYTASEEPQKVLETMLSSCAGQLTYNNGKFNLFVGKERTASGTITDDKLLTPVQITTKASATNLVNGVKASYVNPSNKYQATEIRPYQDSTYLTEDTPSGEASANYEKFMNLTFPYTHTTTTAQRLARIALDYARQDQVLSVVVPIEFMTHQVGDIINLTNDRLGYSGKDFEITSMSFEFIEDNYLALRLNLKEYSTTVFDNISYTEDPTLPDDLDAGDNTVPVPTGLTLTEITKTPSFGDVAKQFYIRANWTNASDEKIAATEVAYKKSTDTVFVAKSVAYGTTRIIESAESDTTYNFKVRHISAEGVAGDYTSVVNITTSSSQGTHSAGSVGGVTVGTDKLYIGTGTFDNANTPFYVDDTGQFSLKDKLSWNGTTLDISGNLTVENTITADKIVVDGINLDNLITASTQSGSIYLTEFTGIKVATAGGTNGYPPLVKLQDDQVTNGFTDILQFSNNLVFRTHGNTTKGAMRFEGRQGTQATPVVYGGFDTDGNFHINYTDVISSARQLQNIASLDSTTTTTIQNAVSGGTTTTINNNADNRVITGSNTADTLNGESNLTYDGSSLDVVSALMLNRGTSGNNTYGLIQNHDYFHEIILRGNPTNNSTGYSQGNVTSFTQYSGDYRFYLKDISNLTLHQQFTSSGIDTKVGGYLVNGTTVISSSRNLINIGTINSGQISSTADISADDSRVRIGNPTGLSGRSGIRIDTTGDAAADLLFGDNTSSTSWTNVNWSLSSRSTSDNQVFRIYRGSGQPSPYNSEAVAVEIARDLGVTFAGTISSGAITASGDITANSGFVKISGSSASEGGELQLLRGTSGTTDINIDNYNNYLRVHSGGSVWMDLESTGINTASYQVSGTTVIDGSRNLTNIGTISSGSHTINTATDGLIFPSSHSEDKIRLYNGGSEKIGTASGVLVLTGNSINFKKVGGAPDLQHNGTVFLNSSRELTNIANISSGDITSSGQVEAKAVSSSDWAFIGYNSASTARSGIWFDNNDGELLLRNNANSLNIRLRSDADSYINSGDVIIGQTSVSYAQNDNSRVVGSTTSNKLHVNGSIQLTSNNDAFVIGNGTATFLSDEELGFGWGGGWYMTDGTYLRVRNNKHLYSTGAITCGAITSSGNITSSGALQINGTTVIDSSRNFVNIASLSMGDQILRLRGSSDSNHFLQFTSTGYSGVTIDGPHLVGYQGGELGTKFTGGNQFALRWDDDGNITVRSNITAYSDGRLKDNIETLDGSKVFAMRGVSFTKDNKAGSGVIAQEIEKIAPELVDTADDDMGTKSVAYGNLVGYLIEAVKELKAEIEELKK